jgi:hypothetical protein
MIRSAINSALGLLGYEIRKNARGRLHGDGVVLYRYTKPDGSFDYEKYREIQQAGNKRKIENVWVREGNIEFLSKLISRIAGPVRFGICHGTRRGKEQEWFRKFLGPGAEVIGTEISETASEFPHTIQWDFHEVKPEWLGAVDFIYSNSFDHSYDPQKCLSAWLSCIRPGGVCILEHSSAHGPGGTSELDPFGADITEMPYLITLWGKGRYGVREIVQAPEKFAALKYMYFIVIQNFTPPAGNGDA